MIIVLIISLIHYFFHLSHGVENYPDSERYMNRTKFPPFHLRWLLPFLLRKNTVAWQIVTGIATVLIPVAMFYFLESWGLSYIQCIIGGLLTLGLKGVFGFNIRVPVLVDSTAMLLMVISATLFNYGMIIPAIAVVVIAGCIKESSPVFTAIVSLNPLALLGLIPVLIMFVRGKTDKHDIGGKKSEEILKHPFKYGISMHSNIWLNYNLWLSFGILLLAFKNPSIHLLLMFGVAFSQMLMATDSIRLLHWCFPVMILYTVPLIPLEWAIPLVILQWINPFGKDMV